MPTPRSTRRPSRPAKKNRKIMAPRGPPRRKLGSQGMNVRPGPQSHWGPRYWALRFPSTLRSAHCPPRSQAHGRRCTSDDPIHPSATPTRGAASFLFAPGSGPGSPDSPQTRRRFLLSLLRGFPASPVPLRAPAPLTHRPIPHRSLSR